MELKMPYLIQKLLHDRNLEIDDGQKIEAIMLLTDELDDPDSVKQAYEYLKNANEYEESEV